MQEAQPTVRYADARSAEEHVDWREANEDEECEDFDGVQNRLEEMSAMLTLSTFITGFAIADLSSFDIDSWGENVTMMTMYTVLMAFVVGNSAFISVVGICLNQATLRIRGRDSHCRGFGSQPVRDAYATKSKYAAMGIADPSRVEHINKVMTMRAEQRLAGPKTEMASQAFLSVFTDEGGPYVRAVRTFPWAMMFYMVAVSLKVMQGAPLIMQIAVPSVLAAWSMPMVFMCQQLLNLTYF